MKVQQTISNEGKQEYGDVMNCPVSVKIEDNVVTFEVNNYATGCDFKRHAVYNATIFEQFNNNSEQYSNTFNISKLIYLLYNYI